MGTVLLFVKQGLRLILYVDACIISLYKHNILSEIKSLQKDYDITDEGELYLGTRL